MYNRYSSGGNTETDIAKRIDALVRFEEELKNGRAYTSGRSGVLGYVVPDSNLYDQMTVQRTDGQPTGLMYSFPLLPTGSMSVGKTFKLTNTYVPKYQDYPVTAPYLQIFANGVEMTYNATTGIWSAGDGSTWSVSINSDLLREITDWNVPKLQRWETFITYFNTVNITIQIKMRIKSTDKGTVSTMAVVF
jgi:hypothetical protein